MLLLGAPPRAAALHSLICSAGLFCSWRSPPSTPRSPSSSGRGRVTTRRSPPSTRFWVMTRAIGSRATPESCATCRRWRRPHPTGSRCSTTARLGRDASSSTRPWGRKPISAGSPRFALKCSASPTRAKRRRPTRARSWPGCPRWSGFPTACMATRFPPPTPACSRLTTCWPRATTSWWTRFWPTCWCLSIPSRIPTAATASCTTSSRRGVSSRTPARWPPSTSSRGPAGASTTTSSISTATGLRSPSPRSSTR